MKANTFVTVAVAALLVAGTFAIAQAPAQPKPDLRIDKLIEQNAQMLKNQDQLLKNQEETLKQLGEVKEGLAILKRRSS